MPVTTPVAPKVSPYVMSQIDEHVGSEPERSAGGLLVGRRALDGLRVVGSIPDRQAQDHDGEIEFSPSVWKDAYARLGEEFPGAQLIGWYHSHPQSDASLTDYDRSLHTAMFSEPQMVSLVVCSRTGTKMWYGWLLDELSELRQSRGDVLDLTDGPPRRRWVTAALAAGLIATAAGGFGIGTATRNPTGRVSATNAAATDQLRSTVHGLQSKLTTSDRQRQALEAKLSATTSALKEERKKARASRAPAYVRYRVKRGDTMWQLAISFYGTPAAWPTIARPNGIKNPNHIEVGQVLKIPATR